MSEHHCQCQNLDNNADRFMHRAIELSYEKMLQGFGGPFGAVIVKDQQIIAEGFNAVLQQKDPTAHAEINAIRNACQVLDTFDLSGCEIYSSCEPCPMCLSAIYWAKLDRLYFANSRQDAAQIGFADEFLYQEIHLPISQRRIPTKQLCTEEAKKAFNLWESKKDKLTY